MATDEEPAVNNLRPVDELEPIDDLHNPSSSPVRQHMSKFLVPRKPDGKSVAQDSDSGDDISSHLISPVSPFIYRWRI